MEFRTTLLRSEISIIVSKGEKEIETNDYEESIEVPFEPEDDEEEQEVVIYIDDLDNKLTDVYKKEVITKDTEFKIKLKIEEDKNAEYKIERDGEEFTKKTISYKEGSEMAEGQNIKEHSRLYYVN